MSFNRYRAAGLAAMAAGMLLPGLGGSVALAGSTAPAVKSDQPAADQPAAPAPSTSSPPTAPQPSTPGAPSTAAPGGGSTAAPSSALPGNITPIAPSPSTTPAGSATLPAPNTAAQKTKVKETTLTGLEDETAKKSRHKSRHAHRREPWPRVSYRAAYYNPYCGPPPVYGVYVVRVGTVRVR